MKPFPNANFKGLEEYIRAISSLPKTQADAPRQFFPFVTISRQTGAGGHSLAEAILQELGAAHSPVAGSWQILDQALCRKALEDPKLCYPLQWLLTERFEKEFYDYMSQLLARTSDQLAVYHKIFKIIRTFATAGKTIVVGRAGAFITQDLPLGVHVRLVAPESLRIQNMMRVFGMNLDQANAAVEEQDAGRRLLVKTCFLKDIEDPLNYDLVCNTERVSIPTIASLVVQLIHQKAALARNQLSAEKAVS